MNREFTIHHWAKVKEIDSGFWRENLDQGGKPLSMAMHELGDLFEPKNGKFPKPLA